MNVVEKYTITDKLVDQINALQLPLWGSAYRKAAIESFKKQGVPNRKNEEYKYCKIDLILKDGFVFNSTKKITTEQLNKVNVLKDAITIVIVNGVFDASLSSLKDLPKGLIVCDIKEASEKHKPVFEKHYSKYADINTDPFIALNTATATGGAFIHIEKNTVVETPIHILHVSTTNENSIINPRNLMVVEKSAQAKIVESFVTIDTTANVFNNALTEIAVDEQANIQHYKLQDEQEFGHLVNTTQIQLEKQSVFSTHNISLAGSFIRNNLNIILNNEGIESHLFGLYITNNEQVIDNHTLVDHQKPNCNSNELYKGIVDGESAATFNGKIFVRKDAQKTNAFQSNKNILLSDDGTVNTKPQLEIFADDVKCSHGTSTGKLDEEKIFYLRTRGLSETSAKKLLMFAFASEVLNDIKIESLKEYLEERILKVFQ